MDSKFNINLAKAKSKKKIENTTPVEKNETKKNNRKSKPLKVEKHKVIKHYHENEYIIFHEGKREPNASLNDHSYKHSKGREVRESMLNRNDDENADSIPEVNIMNLEETPLPSNLLSFPRISLTDKKTISFKLHDHLSNFDFIKNNRNRLQSKSIALLQSENAMIPLDKIPQGGGKIGSLRLYKDNTADLEINGESYNVTSLIKQNMELFAMSPHPSDTAFEMSSLGQIAATFRIDVPQ